MPIQHETELYAPIKRFFEERGYDVRGEVKHCDMVAIRGDEPPVVVELKKSFNIPLLVQGIERLKLTSVVYVAFELPNKGKAPHRLHWDDISRLCRMLGLGVITVQFFKRKQPAVQIVSEPVPYTLRANKRAAGRVVQEFHERSGDYNVGGSTRQKLMTAYREKSLHCAYLLREQGPLSPRQLREQTGHRIVAGLLQNNVYRWFVRIRRGQYGLTPLGEQALAEYGHVLPAFARADAAAAPEADAAAKTGVAETHADEPAAAAEAARPEAARPKAAEAARPKAKRAAKTAAPKADAAALLAAGPGSAAALPPVGEATGATKRAAVRGARSKRGAASAAPAEETPVR